MDASKISDLDQQAVGRAMKYWVEHWDWECPTLFGVELDDLKRVLHRWPLIAEIDQKELEAVVIGALRELIYGASSLPRAGVDEVIGISYNQADALIKALCNE